MTPSSWPVTDSALLELAARLDRLVHDHYPKTDPVARRIAAAYAVGGPLSIAPPAGYEGEKPISGKLVQAKLFPAFEAVAKAVVGEALAVAVAEAAPGWVRATTTFGAWNEQTPEPPRGGALSKLFAALAIPGGAIPEGTSQAVWEAAEHAYSTLVGLTAGNDLGVRARLRAQVATGGPFLHDVFAALKGELTAMVAPLLRVNANDVAQDLNAVADVKAGPTAVERAGWITRLLAAAHPGPTPQAFLLDCAAGSGAHYDLVELHLLVSLALRETTAGATGAFGAMTDYAAQFCVLSGSNPTAPYTLGFVWPVAAPGAPQGRAALLRRTVSTLSGPAVWYAAGWAPAPGAPLTVTPADIRQGGSGVADLLHTLTRVLLAPTGLRAVQRQVPSADPKAPPRTQVQVALPPEVAWTGAAGPRGLPGALAHNIKAVFLDGKPRDSVLSLRRYAELLWPA